MDYIFPKKTTRKNVWKLRFLLIFHLINAEEKNKVFTSKMVYKVGERIEVNCLITSDNVNLNSVVVKQEYGIHGGKQNIENIYTPNITSNNIVQIVLPSANFNNAGTYRCYEKASNNYTKDLTPFTERTICVQDSVKRPKHFACEFIDYTYLKCSWDTDNLTFWTLQYKCKDCSDNFRQCLNMSDNSQLRYNGPTCLHQPNGQCYDNRYNSCTLQIGDVTGIFSYTDYVFRLTGCSKVGNKSWDINVHTGEEIVKLGSVTQLHAIDCNTSICLLWKLTLSPSGTRYGIQCRIYYWITGSHHKHVPAFLNLNTSFLLQNVKFMIPDLQPYTKYAFNVSCRPRNSIYWSDNATTEKTTPPSVPYNGPEFVTGGYSFYRCNHSDRCLVLYWQKLEPFQSQGEVLGYQINVTNRGYTTYSQNINGDKNSAYLDITLDPVRTYEIYGRTINNQGYSISSSHLYIPKEDKAPARPKCIKYESYDEVQQKYNVSYEAQDKDNHNVNVTFYWCNGVMNRSNTVICQSGLRWKSSSGPSVWIQAPQTVHFAVALDNNGFSNGMVWKKCHGVTVVKEDTGISKKAMIAVIAVLSSVPAAVLLTLIVCYLRKKCKYNPPIEVPTVKSSGGVRTVTSSGGTTETPSTDLTIVQNGNIDNICNERVSSSNQHPGECEVQSNTSQNLENNCNERISSSSQHSGEHEVQSNTSQRLENIHHRKFSQYPGEHEEQNNTSQNLENICNGRDSSSNQHPGEHEAQSNTSQSLEAYNCVASNSNFLTSSYFSSIEVTDDYIKAADIHNLTTKTGYSSYTEESERTPQNLNLNFKRTRSDRPDFVGTDSCSDIKAHSENIDKTNIETLSISTNEDIEETEFQSRNTETSQASYYVKITLESEGNMNDV